MGNREKGTVGGGGRLFLQSSPFQLTLDGFRSNSLLSSAASSGMPLPSSVALLFSTVRLPAVPPRRRPKRIALFGHQKKYMETCALRLSLGSLAPDTAGFVCKTREKLECAVGNLIDDVWNKHKQTWAWRHRSRMRVPRQTLHKVRGHNLIHNGCG